MVTVLWARVEARARERRELMRALLDWASTVRQEPGAVCAYLAEDIEESGVYFMASEWRRQGDLEAHVAGPDFGVLLGALQLLAQQSRIELMSAHDGAEEAASMLRRLRGRAPAGALSSRPERPQ